MPKASGSEQTQKAVASPGEADASGQHSRRKSDKRKYFGDFSSSESSGKADEYGRGTWGGLWTGLSLSWTKLRPEVSTGILGKSYIFSRLLNANL